MDVEDRQREIMSLARRRGRVAVEALAARFSVTAQTIRRDLNDLCAQGVLSRVHGGAVPTHSVSNAAYRERRTLASDAKRHIGAATARLIPEHCSLFLNIGTTTEQVAHALVGHRDLVVITNNINVVNILSDSAVRDIIVTGGVLRRTDGGIIGEATIDFINQIKVDFAVIGASALDDDGSILDFDFREVKATQAIIANARQSILVADRLKFARSAPFRIGHVSALARVVTDTPPPAAFAEVCATHGVELDVVAPVAHVWEASAAAS